MTTTERPVTGAAAGINGNDAPDARERLLRRRLLGAGGGRRDTIPAVPRTGPLPLSSGQQQMWFLSRLDPDSWEYTAPLVLRLRGPVDVDRLQRALTGVIGRHEVLRTRYTLVDGQPAQLIDPAGVPDFELVRLDGVAPADRETTAEELARRLPGQPFDLEQQWPIRARLFQIDSADFVLAVVFHHIACDDWSVRVFLAEIQALYGGADLAALTVQFGDYAVWERGQERNQQRSLDYWRQQLQDLTPLELPTDRPRPATRDWRGASVPFALSPEVVAALRVVARNHDATMFMTLLTGFQLMLSRYTGTSDIAVGTVVSGRTRPELQQLIGYGINSLVLRANWTGDPTFGELLGAARRTVAAAFENLDVPFARLVDAVQPDRDMSRTPLFQVAFTMHESRVGAFSLPGVAVEPMVAESPVARFDLTLQMQEAADGTVTGTLEYATALYERPTVQRMAGHLVNLLGQLAGFPALPVSQLSMLGDTELSVVLADPSTGAVEPVTRCVHEAFEEQVARTPDAVALVADGVALSYAELNSRANRLAHHLGRLGVGPETVVGVHLPRGLHLVPTLLAVLKSGAAYLPLDPAQPADRLDFMMADAGVAHLVTSREVAGAVGASVQHLVVVEDDLAADCPDHNPQVVTDPANLIYVIYTSGSTGRPKGVCITHANVIRLLTVAHRHYGFDSTDVWPLFHSYAFDVSVWELWGALLFGGRLVVVPAGVTRSPDDFVDLLIEHGVTVLNQTPSAFKGLVALAAAGDPRIDQLSLRTVVFAGEKLEFGELGPWVARRGLQNPRLANMYGITETTVHSSFYQVAAADLDNDSGNPVGHPLADLRIYLLDQSGSPVPIGVPGEIYVGGPGVARGYLNRPELTAQRFVPDPFGSPGGRLYRSGDLAVRTPDGSLQFRGRIDDQVKIRGYRIELGEIQAAIAAVPGIGNAVVIVRESTSGDRTLVAYLVPAAGARPEVAELRKVLARTLPEYMIPAGFVLLDKLPLTTNGKLDKRALPAPDREALAASRSIQLPRTVTESQLAEIWREILLLDEIGIQDSFFDLGGDSIKAVGLAVALQQAGFDVAVRDLFEYRSIAALGEFVTGRPAPSQQAVVVAPFALISAADRAALPTGLIDAYPVSQAQLGMLVEMLASADSHAYHNITTFRVRDDEPVAEDALRAALDLVVSRHEVLRTGFELEGYTAPLQLVYPSASVALLVQDLRGLDSDAVSLRLQDFHRQQRAELFDITRPGLLRVAAHRCDGDGWWLSITECHPILEGWSHHSLLMELLDCYRLIRDGAEVPVLSAPEVRFADFIDEELAALASADDREYWRETAAQPKFSLPQGWGTDPDGVAETFVVAVAFHDLEARLRGLASRARASMKSVMLAAHLKVLSQLTSERQFTAGLVCDARPERAGAERVYGMFINTLPIGFDRTATTWQQLVRQVFDTEVALWPHRHFPLPAIQRELGGDRLVDVYFNYQDFRQVDDGIIDYRASLDNSATEFPMSVSSRAGLIHLTASSRWLTRYNADRILQMYRSVLEAMADSDSGDAQACYLPAGERAALLADHGGPAAPLPVASVPELFEQQVAATPQALALVSGAKRLTYAELNERSNRIAHRLAALGVGPEDLVGVVLDRGVDLVPALLGVLKAGAGYLPIEPGLPTSRMWFMLSDAKAAAVITEQAHRTVVEEIFDGAILDVGNSALREEPGTNPAIAIDSDNLIYVMYTSGSTGTPKGVAATHRNVLQFLAAANLRFGFRADDVWSLTHSFAFDVAVWEMFGALLFGGRLVVVEQSVIRSPDDLLDVLVTEQVTMLHQTPSAFRGLIQLADIGDPRIAQLCLRTVIIAGEKPQFAEFTPWVAARGLDEPRLYNMYGITETTVESTTHRVVAADLTGNLDPIGHPFHGIDLLLLDGHGRLVPVGVPGEVYIGGHGPARGYLGRPDLTAARFVPDPFGQPGARLYRSGDLARRLPDGSLEFLGRIHEDGSAGDQVKLRGYRIELGEITAVLTGHQDVRAALVVVREDSPGDRRLVAYVVAAGDDSAPSAIDLTAWCAHSLPGYMVPAAFVQLSEFPIAATGKVDRRALPAPGRAALAAALSVVAPRTDIEERIAAVWSTVLEVEHIGVYDSFFDLGGDSIRVISLVGAMRAAGLPAAVRDVFEQQNIARLAALIDGRPVADHGAQPVAPFALISADDRAGLPADVADAYPLSQVQLGMLVEMLTDRTKNAYQSVNSFRIPDDQPFQPAILLAAVRSLTTRHETLRTSVDLTNYSVPMQLVHRTAELPVSFFDLRANDAADQAAMMAEFTADQGRELFDLATAPLMRFSVHLLSETSWRITFTQSHAVTEGWSYHSMLTELITSYRALRDSGQLAEPALPAVRYADFISAELEALRSDDDRAYWTGIVERHPGLVLPDTWTSAPAVSTEIGSAEMILGGVRLEPVEAGLRALAASAKVSLKAVFLAAHLKVMSQLTDQPRFSTGLVWDARPELDGADRVLGMHLNTLPFPYARSAATWRKLVQQVFNQELTGYGHRHFPLPAIQRLAGRDRLVNVIFTYLDFHVVDDGLVDMAATIGNSPNEFDLNVTTLSGLLGLSSNTGVFDRAGMNRLSAMYDAVLSSMADDPDGDALASYLPAGEADRLLTDWNPTAELPQPIPIHRRFEQQAAATPAAVAVSFNGHQLTYAELNEKANRLAHHLSSLGAGPETLVGVCLERAADLVPTLLAVLKSGAGYLPIDPTFPAERRNFMLEDTATRLLVSRSDIDAEFLQRPCSTTILLDADATTIARRLVTNPDIASSADDQMYVIYTSGSTGRPKGVAVTHANVHALFAATGADFQFGPGDVWTMFHTYAFDFSVWELWGPLANGGTVVVVPHDVARDPAAFLDLLVEQRVTILSQTPSAFRGLVTAAADGDRRIGELSLRAVVFGGEKLDFGMLAPWVARVGLDRPVLINMYGITETTVHSTYHQITAGDIKAAQPSRIGRPIAGWQVHLLDNDGRLAPVGVPAEMYVGGAGVSRGYFGRPALTAERFVPDPFGPPGSRLYRSGDVARRLTDGSLEVLGRRDDQVKVRGYRIELGEIAAAIAGQPGVRDAVVIVRDDNLIGYLIPAEGSAPDLTALRSALVEVLPRYMVPAALVPIERIPLTPTGKLDRNALPNPTLGAIAGHTGYVAPATPTQQRLAAVWAEVIGVDRVGIHDGFFDIGGDSLRAVALVGALRSGGLDVQVPDIFVHQSVAALADLLDGRGGLGPKFQPVPPFALISDGDRALLSSDAVDAYPATQAQIGMAVEIETDPEHALYHIASAFRISDDAPLAVEALRAAAQELVDRHETLRTGIDLVGYSVPLQIVRQHAEVTVTVSDNAAAINDFVAQEQHNPFQLDRPPLIRVAAHHNGSPEWWLTLTVSHLVTGGWDFNSLLSDLVASYRRHRTDGAVPGMPVPAVRFADFVAAEQRSLDDPADRDYWQQAVSEHTKLELPAGWGEAGAAADQARETRIAYHDLDPALRAFAAASSVSIKAVLHAAHLKVMSQLTAQDSFFTGLVCDARPEVSGSDRVHGMYINSLPFVYRRGARTWRELVRQVFNQEVDLWPHRRYPLPQIQRNSGADQRLIDVLFDFNDFHQVDGDVVDAETSLGSAGTEFGLTVSTVGGFITVAGNAWTISTEQLGRLADMYRAVLSAMAIDPDGDATRTSLPAGERGLVLRDWAVAPGVAAHQPVLRHFAAQVAARPQAAAVECDGQQLSYLQLDRVANQLAHRLSDLGVSVGSTVGLLLDNGTDLIAALLGVWKAGACVLPLDAAHPASRLRDMLDIAGSELVITSTTYSGRFSCQTLLVDKERAIIEAQPATPVRRPTSPELELDLPAYLLFTSGSTGRPKGVQVSQRNLVSYLVPWATSLAGHGSGGAPLFTSMAVDFSMTVIFGSLLAGQRLTLLPPDRDLADLGAWLSSRAPFSFVSLTPAHLQLLDDQLGAEVGAAISPVYLVGSEALPLPLARRWSVALGDGGLINEYGPTEVTVANAAFPVPAMISRNSTDPNDGSDGSDDSDPNDGSDGFGATDSVPIGRPLPHTSMYVLDAALQPVPVGVPGELYVGGAGVAQGYTGRPDLTAERFIPDPFGEPGARLYRTGDLASWTTDGVVRFLGRADDQIKIRGHRIEPGEIQVALCAHPGIRDAVVLAAGQRLVAHLIAVDPHRVPSADELTAHCSNLLPDYMIPVAFGWLAAIPLNTNGKVDRRALPDLVSAARTPAQLVAPRSAIEERFAAIWEQVLELPEIGVHDGFFELGGDSLRAVALVGALRAAGFAVSVRDVFQHRTIAALAAAVGGTSHDLEALAAISGVLPFALLTADDIDRLPVGLDDAYPLSQVQLGMLAELMADRAEGAYHSVQAHRVRDNGPFDAAALEAALHTVLYRHDVLRTSFALAGYSMPLQLVHAEVRETVRVLVGRELPAELGAKALDDFIAAERNAPFDLGAAPLFRVAVLIENEDSWWLTLTLCHAITEGWSLRLLVGELLQEYTATRNGASTADLAPSTAQNAAPSAASAHVRYADFIAGELESLASSVDAEYWQHIVSDFVPFTVPASWGSSAGPAEPLRAVVDLQEFGDGITELARAERVSVKAVLHAAHQKVLSQLTGDQAFHSGLVCDARPELAGAEKVLGMFLNTLPFAHHTGARTWRDQIRGVFDREVELWPHRRYPLPTIQRNTGGRLIEVLFNYQNFRAEQATASSGLAIDLSVGEGATEFALQVIATLPAVELLTSSSVMSRLHLERLAGMYRAVITAMLDDPDGSAQQVCLPAGERAQLLGGHQQVTPEPVTRRVHEIFEQQVSRTPDAVAAVFGDEFLSYADLNVRANRLAHRLAERGIGPESIVGVCLDRGLDLVPTLLGVLKSGAAYLPLDPAQPAERLAYMLEDAAAATVITDQDRLGLLAGYAGSTMLVEDPALSSQPESNPVSTGGPDNLIYVIYTSGSTGRPKGVCVTHANVVRLLDCGLEHYGFDETDVWPLFHSFAFDVSVWELWGALLFGGRLVVVPAAVTRSPDDFLTLLVRHQVTMLNQTPSAFRGLVALAAAGDPRITELALRAVIFAGEKLEMPDLRPWATRLGLGRITLANMYGITETTVHSSYYRVSRTDLDPNATNRIGRPLPDLRIHLLDARGELVPIGVPGEIYVGGPGVTRGYLNRPALTADRFVPDPFGPAGSRLYRSGDLARRLPDGGFEFCGRIDDQVKIRGYRIELGEIAATLAVHPGVRDAVVVVDHETAEPRLLAYLVPSGPAAPTPAELRAWVVRTLPDYMVPAAFTPLPALPLTTNGKLDKKALPRPDDNAVLRHPYVAPATPTEVTLAGIWSRLLGVADIGTQDRFFDLGGHSILVVQVIAEAQLAGIYPALRMVWENRTLAELAASVQGAADQEELAASVQGAADQADPTAGNPPPVKAMVVPAEVAAPAPTDADKSVPTVTGSSASPPRRPRHAASESAENDSEPSAPRAGTSRHAHRHWIPSPLTAMAELKVPGVSIALLDDGEVVLAAGFGDVAAASQGKASPVTAQTIFPVASVSKLVAAVGVLNLVQTGVLELDVDVNRYLPTGPIPGVDRITLRMLLGHHSGLTSRTQHLYLPGEPVPPLFDLLHGRPPFDEPAVLVKSPANREFRADNVNYAVVQAVVESVTASSFAEVMRRNVFEPLGMVGSSFDQRYPLTADLSVARGHLESGVPIDGGWRTRSDVAAAGLWCTATDLGVLVGEIRAAYLGRSAKLIDPDLAGQMLTSQPGDFYGLGSIVDGRPDNLEFGHHGEAAGYRSLVFSRIADGAGVVVLTNSDAGQGVVRFLSTALAKDLS